MTDTGKCGAVRNGKPCGREAGWGTDHLGYGHCKHHGGLSPNGMKYAAKLAAMNEVQVMGAELDLDPLDALMWCVRVAAGEVAYASRRIAELDPDNAVGNPVTEKRKRIVVHHADLDDPDDQDIEGELVETTAAPVELNVWIKVRHEGLDRLAKFSKMALDAGVDERKIQMAERYGEMLARLIGGILGDLVLTAAQQEQAPIVVRRHMALLEAGPA